MSSSIHLGGRTLARSQALQLLFQAEATGRSVEDVLSGPYALSEGPLDPFGERLALGADSMRSDLDAVISNVSANWSLSRMPSVDRNLLRLAIYEMLEVDEVEIPVTINESVVLAKAFGTDESSRFINGVLGKVSRELDAGEDPIALGRANAAKHAAENADAGEEEDSEPEDGYADYGDHDDSYEDDAEGTEPEDDPIAGHAAAPAGTAKPADGAD